MILTRAAPPERSTIRARLRRHRSVAGSRELADELDTTAAALAVVFALANPSVASVLFGATKPEQVRQNVAALDLGGRLDEKQLATLLAIG